MGVSGDLPDVSSTGTPFSSPGRVAHSARSSISIPSTPSWPSIPKPLERTALAPSCADMAHQGSVAVLPRSPSELGAQSAVAAERRGYDRRLAGFVKFYCPFKGYGIIDCPSVEQPIFIDLAEAQRCDIKIGASITFVVTTNEVGLLQACHVAVIMEGKARRRDAEIESRIGHIRATVDWNKTYVGTIQSLWTDSGYCFAPSMRKNDRGGGFILCEEVHTIFGKDPWVYPDKIPGGKVGDHVKFKIIVDPWWTYPTSHNVEKISFLEMVRLSENLSKQFDEMQKVESLLSLHKPVQALGNLSEWTPTQASEERASAGQTRNTWELFTTEEDGDWYNWWWCEADGDWFLEDSPGPWTKYIDPDSEGQYWWKDDDKFFFVTADGRFGTDVAPTVQFLTEQPLPRDLINPLVVEAM